MYAIRSEKPSFEPQQIWHALADPTRRSLLDRLAEGPCTTSDLCDGAPMSRFGIMKHLGILEEAGLVIARRQGRFRYNHLNAAPLRALQERWLSRQGERAAAIADGIGKVAREESMPDIEKNNAAIAEVALDWTIEAPIQRVWRSLIDGVDSWWPSEHRAGEPGAVFHFEAELGGKVQEVNPGGGGVLWYTVIALASRRSIDLSGSLAARYGGPAISLLCIELTPASTEGATILKLTDSVFGRVGPKLRSTLSSGWQAIIGVGFKNYAEVAKR